MTLIIKGEVKNVEQSAMRLMPASPSGSQFLANSGSSPDSQLEPMVPRLTQPRRHQYGYYSADGNQFPYSKRQARATSIVQVDYGQFVKAIAGFDEAQLSAAPSFVHGQLAHQQLIETVVHSALDYRWSKDELISICEAYAIPLPDHINSFSLWSALQQYKIEN